MDDERYGQAVRGVTQFWAWTVPALFLVLVLLGLMMRSNQAGIINADGFHFHSEVVFTLLDERLRHCGERGDRPVQP